ncbi:MAG: hypothetical protein KAS63_01215 [Candidatus Heimdallarchaeota archaeon]|nr:hypothetical protein [Candidatus Heimdallarchaeota archaeon]MCK4953962.1 hypothetical protein [Candidatus Heimdallarchaeota archaeon]
MKVKDKTQERKVITVTLLASLIMIAVSTGIIFLLLFVERRTGDWAREIWGVIYLIIFSLFGLYHLLIHPFFFGKRKDSKKDQEAPN